MFSLFSGGHPPSSPRCTFACAACSIKHLTLPLPLHGSRSHIHTTHTPDEHARRALFSLTHAHARRRISARLLLAYLWCVLPHLRRAARRRHIRMITPLLCMHPPVGGPTSSARMCTARPSKVNQMSTKAPPAPCPVESVAQHNVISA